MNTDSLQTEICTFSVLKLCASRTQPPTDSNVPLVLSTNVMSQSPLMTALILSK